MAELGLAKLCSEQKLERDRGYHGLTAVLKTASQEEIRNVETEALKLLSDKQSGWEKKHGGLMGGKAILLLDQINDDFALQMSVFALDFLDDIEFRVRIAAGDVMGTLCKKLGPEIYTKSKDKILEGIKHNLERESLNESEKSENEETEKLMEKLSSSPGKQEFRSADQIFHDTAGWKSLETWMKCLQCVVEGCGHRFNAHVDQPLLDLIFSALTHTNRFVKETGFYVCSSLVSIGVKEEGKEVLPQINENAIYRHGDQFSEYLAMGLADNWSQVRLAASVATRNFLHSIPTEEAKENFYPILLPKMCLNRYYVAEGVRIYSQDTWKQVTEGEGRHMVEKYINPVVEYYIEATDADNHAVREAACACIAELGSKIDRSYVKPSVSRLLEALLICFNDDSWPVRDAACIASGNFILCFPEDSRSSLPALYPLFYGNLQDNIPSVRQGAALALSNVVQVYGQEALDVVIAKIKEGLDGVEKQSASSEKYSDIDKSPATYGVVKTRRDNDPEIHTDQQMYSCGSLAPKMGRGSRGGGCMDHKFRKPSEPWELADGCVHLLAELSSHPDLAQSVSQLLPVLAKATTYKHYTHHITFFETICKQLPNIAKGLGKRHFKPHLESFFDCIFYSLSCDNALTSSAASQCLNQMSGFIGPNILRGRVEQYDMRYLDQLDSNQFIAAL